MTITHPTHNSSEESLHPNVIKVAFRMWVKTPVLWRVWSHTNPPASKTRQKDTKTEIQKFKLLTVN